MNFFDGIMGPLDKSYCVFVYALGVIVFLLAVAGLFSGVFLLLFKSGDKNLKTVFLSGGIATILNSLVLFVSYYLYRIVYNICIKVL